MKVYFDTLGCPKNITDSEIAMGLLEQCGHSIVSSPEEADAIVVNTCGFIEDAKKESISEIFSMADYKEQGKKLIVSGCLVQRYAKELYNEIPEADGFLGVNDYEKLPDLLTSLEENGQRFLANDDAPRDLSENRARKFGEHPYTSYLKIAEGCNNNCTYCAIPSIRGPYRSRTEADILEEARALAKAGCKELILIAEDVTCYGIDLPGRPTLAALLRQLCRIDGIQWIRLLYCYEDKITDELIQTIAEEDKICNYLDIPLQHTADPVLKAMKRRSTSRSITETLKKLHDAIPDIHIRTTLIVGFPGETDDDFSVLMHFVEKEKFARLGVFTYSREEGTPAADMADQIPESVSKERQDALMMEQMAISLAHNRELVGSTVEVMVDEIDDDGFCIGRTRYDAPEIDNSVIFTPVRPHSPGDIVNVEILEAFDYDLEGREVLNEFAK